MKISQEKLNEIIKNHGKWLNDEDGGIKANLRSADLRFADLRFADLRFADLRSADLSSANLRSADLRFADLRSADLSSANLRSADLSSANLRSADLSFADLRSADTDKKYLQIICIGSRKDRLTYCFEDDLILCGCWNNYKGGTLKEFEQRINSVYGNKESEKEKQYFNEYIGAINYIKFLRGE